jgi:hypothetical protein
MVFNNDLNVKVNLNAMIKIYFSIKVGKTSGKRKRGIVVSKKLMKDPGSC